MKSEDCLWRQRRRGLKDSGRGGAHKVAICPTDRYKFSTEEV